MKKKVIKILEIICIVIVVLFLIGYIIGFVSGVIKRQKEDKQQEQEYINNIKKYESYIGYWYNETPKTENLEECDEIFIKSIDDNVIVFDYYFKGLCDDENIKAKIEDSYGEFKADNSSGAIKIQDNKIQIQVKNINYSSTIKKTFVNKSSRSINDDIKLKKQNYIGTWDDTKRLNTLTIKSFNRNDINFNIGISLEKDGSTFILKLDNIKALYDSENKTAEFITDNSNLYSGVQGKLIFEDNKLKLVISKSIYSDIVPNEYIFEIK